MGFDVSFDKETTPDFDKRLDRRLLKELPGILNLALAGALQWGERGLDPPEKVVRRTAEYRKEQDTLGDFFEEFCVTGDTKEVLSSDLKKEYKAWCEREGQKPMSANEFAALLQERGFKPDRFGHKQSRGWRGIGLLDADSRQQQTAKNESLRSGDRVSVTEAKETEPSLTAHGKNFPETPSAVSALSAPTVPSKPFNCYTYTAYTLLEGLLGKRPLPTTDAFPKEDLLPYRKPSGPAPLAFADAVRGHHTAANCPFKGCPGPHAPEPSTTVWTGAFTDVTQDPDDARNDREETP